MYTVQLNHKIKITFFEITRGITSFFITFIVLMKDDHFIRGLRMMIVINYSCIELNGAKNEIQFNILNYPVQK